MKSIVVGIAICVAAATASGSQSGGKASGGQVVATPSASATPSAAVEKGAKWLAATQGADGGWGQDGGETSYVRTGERLESSGNDVANTAVAALALLQAGKQYQPQVDRALAFILKKVEASPKDGLAVTDQKGTQIQRKLGPYIDTFLTSMLLARVDGNRPKAEENARVRKALEKCVAKIESNQKADGSWNVAGGWAPVLGTSMASRSLFEAGQKGVQLDSAVTQRAEVYTKDALSAAAAPPPAPAGTALTASGGTLGGVAGGTISGFTFSSASAGSFADAAGVPLYQNAQALEQMTRTAEDRQKNAKEIASIQSQLADSRFVQGFGSIGGEEFFSYLNISDSLKRAGGEEWKKWHSDMTKKIVSMQNADGTWAGSHCITGRVAVTSAAILNLTLDAAN